MDVTISNTDWQVISAVRDALAAASSDGADVFARVVVTAGEAAARSTQFTDSPLAVVRYLAGREDSSPEGLRGGQVELELLLAAQQDDEPSRLQAVLALRAAAMNAVEASPPPAASAWGDGNRYQPAIQWGRPKLDTATRPPWALARQPLTVGYVLPSPTSH